MGLTYTGGEKGSEHPGLPERDLKEGEMKEFGGRDQLEGTGLYVVEPRDVKPKRKPSAKQVAQRAAAKKKSVAKKAVAFTRRANVELKRATAVVKADVASRAKKVKAAVKSKKAKGKK